MLIIPPKKKESDKWFHLLKDYESVFDAGFVQKCKKQIKTLEELEFLPDTMGVVGDKRIYFSYHTKNREVSIIVEKDKTSLEFYDYTNYKNFVSPMVDRVDVLVTSYFYQSIEMAFPQDMFIERMNSHYFKRIIIFVTTELPYLEKSTKAFLHFAQDYDILPLNVFIEKEEVKFVYSNGIVSLNKFNLVRINYVQYAFGCHLAEMIKTLHNKLKHFKIKIKETVSKL